MVKVVAIGFSIIRNRNFFITSKIKQKQGQNKSTILKQNRNCSDSTNRIKLTMILKFLLFIQKLIFIFHIPISQSSFQFYTIIKTLENIQHILNQQPNIKNKQKIFQINLHLAQISHTQEVFQNNLEYNELNVSFCVSNCATCSDTAVAQCLTCSPAPSLILNAKKCVRDTATCSVENCVTCSPDHTCTVCAANFYLYQNKCHMCKFPCSNCGLPSIGTLYTDAPVQTLITEYYDAAHTGATFPAGTDDTDQKKGNLLDLYLLIKLANPNGIDARKTAIANRLKTVAPIIFTSNTAIDSTTQLTNQQKAAFLNAILSGTTYTATNIHTYIDNQIKSQELLNCIGGCALQYAFVTDTCVACSAGCTACTDAATCTACRNGYYKSGNACALCDPSCLTCSGTGNTACTACVAPKKVSAGGSCVTCTALNCDTCAADTTKCSTCIRPYSRLPDPTTGACYTCTSDQCLHCSPTNTSQCIQCQSGYVIKASDKSCIACGTNCQSCTQNAGNTLCRGCVTGYVLQGGTCNACPGNCIKCSIISKDVCLTCKDGFYINSDNTCSACDVDCQLCTQGNICTKLKVGYTRKNNIGVRCGMSCRKCDSVTPSTCIECQRGYYLNNGICKRCVKGCLACNDGTSCATCLGGTHFADAQCKSCTGNCLTCQGAVALGNCTACKKGYLLNATSKACDLRCGKGCVACSDADTCTQCDRGFALQTTNNTCIKCMRGCSGTCDPTNVKTCLSCAPGFQLVSGVCTKCSTGCLSCSGSVCTACVAGYKLGTDNTCSKDCKAPCATCDDNGRCLTCVSGYESTASNGICLTDVSCATATPPNCPSPCPPGTYNNGTVNTCTRCPTGCYTCTSGTVCTSCHGGYFLNTNNLCDACSSKCKTCTKDAQTCGECSNSFVKDMANQNPDLANANTNVAGACTPCTGKCNTCSIQSDQCQTCSGDFTLKDFQCFGRNKIKFRHRFEKAYQQFLANSHIQAVLNKIAEILNIDLSNIAVNNLAEGSTIVQGQISTESQAQAIQMANTLYDAVAANPSVLGFTALQNSVGAYYDDTQTYSPGGWRLNVAGIIIGCSIAVAAIILIVLGIVCICRKMKGSPEEEIENAENKQRVDREYKTQFAAYDYNVPEPNYLRTGDNVTLHELRPVHY